MRMERSSGRCGRGFLGEFEKERDILLADIVEHEGLERTRANFNRGHGSDSSRFQGDDGLLLNGHANWLHEKERQHQSQSDQGLIGGRALGAERLAKKMEDDEQAHKWRHRQHQRGDQGEKRQQDENRPGSLAGAEIDQRSLRGRDRRDDRDNRRGVGREGGRGYQQDAGQGQQTLHALSWPRGREAMAGERCAVISARRETEVAAPPMRNRCLPTRTMRDKALLAELLHFQ